MTGAQKTATTLQRDGGTENQMGAGLPASIAIKVPERQQTFTIDIEQFKRRLLEDCLTEATAAYWRRRAETFDQVPLPDVALACRRHATAIEAGWF